jgi:hypothetical protein
MNTCARSLNTHAQSLNKFNMALAFVNVPSLDGVSSDSTQIIVRVGNITKDTASTNEIMANRGLRIILKGYPSEFRVAVLRFAITTINRNGDTIAVNVGTNGNSLSADQIHELHKLNDFGKVIFHGIYAVGESARVRELNPVSLIIRP